MDLIDVGIEAMNPYGGRASLEVRELFEARRLDLTRFDNLLMRQKAVALPWEDAVTNAVNAAAPLVRALGEDERSRIELLITATESGFDFGKAIGTYVHDLLGLPRTCRVFEVKQACYAGTAGLQMAAGLIASRASPGAKALVIAADEARQGSRETYHEPSQGTGAVAVLVGESPDVLRLDLGASGLCSFEVMDTCRPQPGIEAGDPDLSLLSYLECLRQSFAAYAARVDGANLRESFDYLVFHTPFAGMVKGAHRNLMRAHGTELGGGRPTADAIDEDFRRRMAPSLEYCTQVGNIYSGTVFLALCSLFDHVEAGPFQRVGIFSYGSGCSSEFYSGTFTPAARLRQARLAIRERLATRHALSIEEYERILDRSGEIAFGTRDAEVAIGDMVSIYERQFDGRGLLRLVRIKGFHREYAWT